MCTSYYVMSSGLIEDPLNLRLCEHPAQHRPPYSGTSSGLPGASMVEMEGGDNHVLDEGEWSKFWKWRAIVGSCDARSNPAVIPERIWNLIRYSI